MVFLSRVENGSQDPFGGFHPDGSDLLHDGCKVVLELRPAMRTAYGRFPLGKALLPGKQGLRETEVMGPDLAGC